MATEIRLLLADDDPDDIELLQEVLLEIAPEHTLYCVDCGENVMEAVKKYLPDLIFLDYNMPRCNGIECLKSLKGNGATKSIPVVMYSSSSATSTVKACYELGATRYLIKPVTYPGIFKGLEIVLDIYKKNQLVPVKFEQFVIDTSKLK